MPNPKCDQNQDKAQNLDIKVHVNAVNDVLWPHTNAGRDDSCGLWQYLTKGSNKF